MEFTFSIRGAIKEAWALFKKHVWFFVALAAVSVVLNLVGGKTNKHLPVVVEIILGVVAFLWSMVVMKFALAAADGKEEVLSLSHIQSMFPTAKQALQFAGVGLLGGLLMLCGFVLLIIPGFWVLFRLSVANFAYLDKGEGIRKSLRTSWDMTKGHAFWTTVLVCTVSGALYIFGFIFFGIGILVTYPLAMILMAKFYRALTVHHAGLAPATVVVQPAEIVAPAPAPEVHTEPHHESETPNQ